MLRAAALGVNHGGLGKADALGLPKLGAAWLTKRQRLAVNEPAEGWLSSFASNGTCSPWLKVNERKLVLSIDAERLMMSFSSCDVVRVINRTGSFVWEREMTIAGERKRPLAWDRHPAQGGCTEKAPAFTWWSPNAAN